MSLVKYFCKFVFELRVVDKKMFQKFLAVIIPSGPDKFLTKILSQLFEIVHQFFKSIFKSGFS